MISEYLRPRIKVDENGCWRWQLCLNSAGYAKATINQKSWLVHRFSFVSTHGPVPEGLVLDHLCRVRDCVNPDHLEPVTRGENVLRGDTIASRNASKTHCIRGHLLPPDRICRACGRARQYPKKPRLSDAQVAEVVRRARHGERPEDLADEFGVSWSVIYMWRRGEGRGANI